MPNRVRETEGEADIAALRARRSGPTRAGDVPAAHGKDAELEEAGPVEICLLVGRRPVGDEGASQTSVDESVAASLPIGWGNRLVKLPVFRYASGCR